MDKIVANAKHASLLRQKVKNFAAKSFFLNISQMEKSAVAKVGHLPCISHRSNFQVDYKALPILGTIMSVER
jgi:hypothetical protein